MKRIGNVFEQVCDFAALEQAAYRAFRANRGNGDALQFMYRLEPRQSGRQLEQQRPELSFGESQQQFARQSQQQHRVPPCQLIAPPVHVCSWMYMPCTGDDPAVILFRAKSRTNSNRRGRLGSVMRRAAPLPVARL